MSDLVTRMDIALHDRVQAFQDAIRQLKNKVKSGAHQVEDDFYETIEDIEDIIESGRERVAHATEIIDDLSLDTLDNIQGWRKSREVKKLEKEAEKSRHYAEAAIDVAIGALDEAEWALSRAFMTKEYAESAAK